MSAEFLGTYENSVNKRRIIIPVELRRCVGASAKSQFIATIGFKGNIVIYPLDNWTTLREKLKNGSDEDRDLLEDLREYATGAQKPEGPGRIKLSDELLEYAGITNKVVIKGMGSFIAVWDPERLKAVKRKRLEERKALYTSQNYQV